MAPGGLLGAQCAPMPDTRGDVLCPTCGLWTPPAPFCTECGAVLQVGLQETASGGGSDVFRRGHEVEQPGSPWGQSERFEPEPEDQAARAAAAAAAGAAGAARVDHFAEIEPAAPEPEWPSEPGLGGDAPPVSDETHPGAPMGAAAATAAAMAGADDDLTTEEPPAPKRRTKAKAAATAAAVGAAAGAAATGAAVTGAAPPKSTPPTPPIVEPPPAPPPAPPPVTYAGPPQDGGDDGNSGVSGLVFVLFLGLGILALLGGAILGGVFDGGVAEASPTPSATVSTPSAGAVADAIGLGVIGSVDRAKRGADPDPGPGLGRLHRPRRAVRRAAERPDLRQQRRREQRPCLDPGQLPPRTGV